MAAADLEELVSRVRAAASAGHVESALRLAFEAVHVAEEERSTIRPSLRLAQEGCWEAAIEELKVFHAEGARFMGLASLLALALTGPDAPGEATLSGAERVLEEIAALTVGSYSPLDDLDSSLVLWLVGRACELGLSEPDRLLASIEEHETKGVVEALTRQIIGTTPAEELDCWQAPWTKPVSLRSEGAIARLELGLRLVEGHDPKESHARGERGQCFALLAQVFALLGHLDQAAELLARALHETSLLETELHTDDTFDRQPCISAIAQACAAHGGEAALAILQQARREANEIKHLGWLGSAVESLAVAAAELGDPQLARSLVEKFPAPGWNLSLAITSVISTAPP